MPSSLELTIGKQMALAVLGNDYVAAYALADALQEERARGEHSLESKVEKLMNHPTVGDGYAVYHWPEFQAFCKRAGIMWGLKTRKITITLAEGELLVVNQEYLASDTGPVI